MREVFIVFELFATSHPGFLPLLLIFDDDSFLSLSRRSLSNYVTLSLEIEGAENKSLQPSVLKTKRIMC